MYELPDPGMSFGLPMYGNLRSRSRWLSSALPNRSTVSGKCAQEQARISSKSVSAASEQFWVLECRSALRGAPNTGRLLQFDSPAGRVIATGLQGPAGMVLDPATGDIFAAENAGGRITRVRLL